VCAVCATVARLFCSDVHYLVAANGRANFSVYLVTSQFKQFEWQFPLRFDLLVNRCLLLIEVKAVTDVRTINKAKSLSYMKLLDITLGPLFASMNCRD